ncbi:hypothetical protein C8J56DRAFT_896486 [Mycena floridula]|nr:hypothetical protein C8J56DRAFT_896486 [Mycena floridula]
MSANSERTWSHVYHDDGNHMPDSRGLVQDRIDRMFKVKLSLLTNSNSIRKAVYLGKPYSSARTFAIPDKQYHLSPNLTARKTVKNLKRTGTAKAADGNQKR